MDTKFKNKAKILGLDISTKTIGWALFDITGSHLLELTHFSPKIKPQPEDKIEELLKKSDGFRKHLENYRDMGITKIIIEEPLLNSNNVYTVGTLLRYNSMVLKSCYDVLGIVPTFISTYNARKFAFPDLVGDYLFGRPAPAACANPWLHRSSSRHAADAARSAPGPGQHPVIGL